MRFSICITSYNYAQYLPEAIESVLNQTYRDFEIIVVNDGSTDETDKAIIPYLGKVIYIKQTNRGLPSTRNSGILSAKGKYVLFLDADDTIHPLYFEEANRIIKQNPDADVVYPDVNYFGERQGYALCETPITKENFRRENLLPYCSVIKKSCLQECGGYNVKMVYGWEDFALWIDLLLRGKKFIRMNKPYFNYRKHGASMIDASSGNKEIETKCWNLLKQYYPDLWLL